ncbi:kinase-like domain-containing protein [Rhizophagus diaphanus]|nr:kinase-like domain-containing protein [Rhizophagus diaphanus] [Rhizophagus sp. MUCL 43196]
MQNLDDNNESDWIEEAIAKEYLRYYDYKNFTDVKKIGRGGFGKVYRARWKNTEQYFALKSFINSEDSGQKEITIEEIVSELKAQRDVDFHNNIIKFHGITVSEKENKNKTKKYLLVMQYADGGSLRDYLKENFDMLSWRNKISLAYQLAGAVYCLHDEGIIHRDLHSGNVLIHQNSVKLSDFGLSKRIESLNTRSNLFGIYSYVDPKKFSLESYILNEKSDVYSIGVLLWEISSGQPPFKEKRNFFLTVNIPKGLRETPIPDTPIEYVDLYTECWDGEPDKRPVMSEVVIRLKSILDNMNNEDSQQQLNQYCQALMYKNGIRFNKDHNRAFELSKESADGEYSDGMNMVGECYYEGIGIEEDKQMALEWFKRSANFGNSAAKYNLARMYKNGEVVGKDDKKALELFKSSAQMRFSDLKNIIEQHSDLVDENSKQKVTDLGNKINCIELGLNFDADNYEKI